MKLAYIPPVSLIQTTGRTDYQLLLPMLWTFPQYRNQYLRLRKTTKQYMILDNGVAEHIAFPDESLMAVGEDADVDEVVVPDVLQDREATIYRATNFKANIVDVGEDEGR